MPLIDMPLAELQRYQGINPRPADFDSYWESALKEMRGVDPSPSLTPAEFHLPWAECFHFTFTGVRGARIYAKLVRPRSAELPHPAVLLFHGYSGSSGDWSGLLSYASLGYTVAAMDCRGQGGRSEDSGGVHGTTHKGHIIRGLGDEDPHQLLFRHIFLDTAQLAGLVMEMDEVDETRVGVHGGSQGGALTLACGALEPRVKRIAPVFPFLCDYRRVWEMDLAAHAYEELRTYFRHFDPLHTHEHEIWERLGYIDIQHLAPRISAEVLMGTALMDNVCPPSTQFAAYNKITAPKEMAIYPDFGHENLPGFNDRVLEFFQGL